MLKLDIMCRNKHNFDTKMDTLHSICLPVFMEDITNQPYIKRTNSSTF